MKVPSHFCVIYPFRAVLERSSVTCMEVGGHMKVCIPMLWLCIGVIYDTRVERNELKKDEQNTMATSAGHW
jgi:hypothetical protein